MDRFAVFIFYIAAGIFFSFKPPNNEKSSFADRAIRSKIIKRTDYC